LSEEQESEIKMLNERKEALEREIQLKVRVVAETEAKHRKIQDEMDLKAYEMNEQAKVINE
jgi:hypothetical protein